VAAAFEELIKNAQFKHIILSYSTDGLMSTDTIEEIMKKYGKPDTFEIYEIPYRRYKSRNATLTDQLKELLVYIEK
jgi:adenine-specific DNA-methyltransferase